MWSLWLIVGFSVAVTMLVQYSFTSGSATSQKSPQIQATRSTRLHLARRAQHALTGLVFVGISWSELMSHFADAMTLFCCALAFLFIHYLRTIYPKFNKFLVRKYASILRKHEAEGGIPGAFYFLLGCAVCGFLSSRHVHQLAMLFLALADPAAGLVNANYCPLPNPNACIFLFFFLPRAFCHKHIIF